ncbi:hypothetical protein LOTGIDRAFT_145975, partial [Lottia gigantea]
MDIEEYENLKSGVRHYNKECTVIFRVKDVKKLDINKLIDAVEERIGLGNCYGCVPRNPDIIEVTVDCVNNAIIISDGVEVDSDFLSGEILYSRYMVVSILNLPTYIEDDVIVQKLENFVEVSGPVRRRYYNKFKGCTDGTRYVRCKFPSNITSLPWAFSFETVEGARSFRLIHDNQRKVCRQCLSEDHIFSKCPDTQCRRCRLYGHISADCTAQKCELCRRYNCNCNRHISEEDGRIDENHKDTNKRNEDN